MLVVAPLLIGVALVAALSLIPEPHRQRFSAVVVGGAGAAYLSGGGFGPLELLFTTVATVVAFLGLRSYRWIGVAWLMHTAWDAAHHLSGDPILPWAEHSSLGCAICDPVLALWYFAKAPSIPDMVRWSRRALRPRSRPDAAADDVKRTDPDVAGQLRG